MIDIPMPEQTRPPPKVPDAPNRQRSPWPLAVLMLAVLGAVFAYLVYLEHGSTLARERDSLEAQARVVDENLGQQLLGVSSALSSIRSDVFAMLEDGETRQLSSRLKALADAQPGVRTMLAIDASGKVVGTSRPELMGIDLSRRAYFLEAKARPNPDTLYVSEPFETTSKVFSVNVLKIWTDEDGRFAGIVTATLDPQYFEVLLRSVLYAQATRSTLLHGSGLVFISLPADDVAKGANRAGAGSLFDKHRESGQRESFFGQSTDAGGEGLLIAFRSTQPAALYMDKPLITTISRPMHAVLAPWRSLARLYAGAYGLLAIACVVGTLLLQRERTALAALRIAGEQASLEHSERLDMALAGGDLGLWDVDVRAGTRKVNARAQEMVGSEPGGPVDDNAQWLARMHPDDREAWLAVRDTHQAGQTASVVADYRIRHTQGHWVWIHSRGRVMARDANGEALRKIGTYLDVTVRKTADAQIKHSAELLARMSRVSRTGGWDFDLRTGLSTWSPEMFRIREMDPTLMPSQPPPQDMLEAYLPEYREQLQAARTAALKHQTPWDMELQMTTATGNVIWVRSQGEAVVENGVLTGLTGTLKNVTWRKQSQIDLKIANEKLERMALSDGLTGIANRRLFDQRLQAEWQRCARAKQPLALLMIDIDHFKLYNDHYGHAGGDDCLRRVAQTLAACSRRSSDLVSRFGGEEFAILLPATDLPSALVVAQACLDAIRKEAIVHAASLVGPWLSLSIGAASMSPGAEQAAQALVERADAALYRAKHLGRARYATLEEETPERPNH